MKNGETCREWCPTLSGWKLIWACLAQDSIVFTDGMGMPSCKLLKLRVWSAYSSVSGTSRSSPPSYVKGPQDVDVTLLGTYNAPRRFFTCADFITRLTILKRLKTAHNMTQTSNCDCVEVTKEQIRYSAGFWKARRWLRAVRERVHPKPTSPPLRANHYPLE